ncbi:MAG: cobalamin-dependent protein, partial [Eubacterium sp.]
LDEMNLYETLVSEHKKGTIVLGTIQGDIHDIGKSVFKNAAVLSGFDVIDLGVDVSSQMFIDAIYTHHPDILGISIVLTDVVKNAVATLERIKNEKFEDLKIIIGGVAANALKDAFPHIDACTNNVLQGLEICSNMVKCHEKKH